MSIIDHVDKLDKSYRHLRAGSKYLVSADFKDYDGRVHKVGEIWTFIVSNFVPYEDGLSLFATINGTDQQVRLQHRPEEQGAIIEKLSEYLVPSV